MKILPGPTPHVTTTPNLFAHPGSAPAPRAAQLDADAAGLRDGRGKYCLGFGIGPVGAIPALGCLLACQTNDARW